MSNWVAYGKQVNDLYETEPWAVHVLLRHFPVRGRKVWEPAAGNHKIADVLALAGADVTTSDVATYGRKHAFVFDFLLNSAGGSGATNRDIITNPPYGTQNRTAATFARLALQRTDGWVALLLTAKFDCGKTRSDLFADNPRFAFKVVLVDRIRWFANTKNTGGMEDHAWYVWGPLWQPPPRLYYGGK